MAAEEKKKKERSGLSAFLTLLILVPLLAILLALTPRMWGDEVKQKDVLPETPAWVGQVWDKLKQPPQAPGGGETRPTKPTRPPRPTRPTRPPRPPKK